MEIKPQMNADKRRKKFFRQDKQDYQDSIFDSNYPVYPVNPVKFFSFDSFVKISAIRGFTNLFLFQTYLINLHIIFQNFRDNN